MNNDEQKIKDLVTKWLEASRNHETGKVLDLMTDDVIFLVPGKEPFGKDEFRAGQESLKEAKFEFDFEIKEIEVMGDRAWMRNRLTVTIVAPDGERNVRTGYTLTILRRDDSGERAIARDANPLS